jgi:CheY-like chemotaxis protein
MAVDKRILIVDDEEKVVFFLRESLEELGHDVTIGTAQSAEEALEKIATQPYDLVISDLRMPGIDGLQLIEAVKEKYPSTRFILMTAYGTDEVEARARHLDVYDYITKPFHVSDLLDVTRHALLPPAETPRQGVLQDDRVEASNRALSSLRFEVGAQCVVLANMKGQIISEVGITQGLEIDTFVPLVADALATVSGMARHLRDEETFNLNFHEGKKYDVYYTRVGDDLLLALVFDRRKQPSRIGMVWLYVKRAIQDLLRATHGAEDDTPYQPETLEREPPSEREFEPAESTAGEGPIEESVAESPQPERVGETPDERGGRDSTFGIEEALRKGLIDEAFARLLQGVD